ncbi:MAG: asparagine synthase-related protein [bacterium]
MSNLCGAWAISGGPIDKYLKESDKNAMLAQLSVGACDAGHDLPQGLRQFSRGPLWVASAAGNMAHDGRACMAMVGFIAFEEGGPRSLGALFEQQKSRVAFNVFLNGHYALVYADIARNVLTLLRDPTGGEHLFYVCANNLLLFSVSARPLLAHSLIPRTLDTETATEFLLNGHMLFGSRTLFSGIQQVLPGHLLELSRDAIKLRRHWKPLFEPLQTDPIDTPGRLKQSLVRATKMAIGDDSQAAVSLSGGVDSAVIAACTVELLGPKNVHAFTYEYQDLSHPSEVSCARQLCRHLGIRHRVIKISYRDHLDAIPEILWLMDNLDQPDRLTRILLLSRKVRQDGFAKILEGQGIEDVLGIFIHGGYLDNMAEVLPYIPFPKWMLRFWRLAVLPRKNWRMPLLLLADKAGKIHPGLRIPPPGLYYLILCVLQHNGIIGDISVFYPPDLREMVRRTVVSPHISGIIKEIKGLPLSVQLQYLNYSCIVLGINGSRKMTLARSCGVSLIAPAMFLHSACLSSHFRPGPRPGRVLLEEAMRDIVPETVFQRPKDMALTPVSLSWFSETAQFLASVASDSRERLKTRYFKNFDSSRKYFDESQFLPGFWHVPFGLRNMNVLALWHKVHMELPLRTIPPDWATLKAASDRR